ncbi:hypothetical protein FACS189462_1180 [Spirochaetia bacterium]|nr:hypothetical protein FACS189462_1180 [Spirochaetia bacterium]
MKANVWIISTIIITSLCLFISLNNHFEWVCCLKIFFHDDLYIFELLKVASFGGIALIVNCYLRGKAEDQLVIQKNNFLQKKENKFTSSIVSHFFIRNQKTWVKSSLYGEWKGMYDRLPENDLKYQEVFYINDKEVNDKVFHEKITGNISMSRNTDFYSYYAAESPCEYVISRYSKKLYVFPPLENNSFSKEKYDEIFRSENKITNIFKPSRKKRRAVPDLSSGSR